MAILTEEDIDNEIKELISGIKASLKEINAYDTAWYYKYLPMSSALAGWLLVKNQVKQGLMDKSIVEPKKVKADCLFSLDGKEPF